MSLLMVTSVMFAVGLFMFLLPPIPIYLTSGIVLVNSGLPIFGLVGAISFTVAFAIILKIFACVVQQKLIGEKLSDSVSIRQAVSVNSGPIRAAKLVLSEKKLTLAKVAFLVGGPDWPTSVLCGIMRVDVLPIILGTLPVILIILPTVLTGAFLFLKSLPVLHDGTPPYPWAEAAGAVCVMSSAAIQICCMGGAAIFIERTMTERATELEQLDIDEDVQDADDSASQETLKFYEINSWEKISFSSKFFLWLALLFMIVSVHIVLIFGSRCFVKYELTYSIQEHLDGNVLNFVKPLGWTAIVLFFLSYFFISIFNNSAGKAVDLIISEDGVFA